MKEFTIRLCLVVTLETLTINSLQYDYTISPISRTNMQSCIGKNLWGLHPTERMPDKPNKAGNGRGGPSQEREYQFIA